MLELKNLHFGFGRQLLFNGFDISFSVNGLHGVLGKNGAGKTSLFRLLYGHYQTDASLSFNGQPITKGDISYLETENFFYEYIKGAEYLSLINKDHPQIAAYAELFDLPLDEYAHNYSTGMKKKLAIVGCLIQDRPILILDEPFNGVDLMGNELILGLLNKIKSHKTIIVSSHILSTLVEHCDDIYLLDKGILKGRYKPSEYDKLLGNIKEDINSKLNAFEA